MINSISNINFKAVGLVKQSQFSESQRKVAEDIQKRLGKKGERYDFIIEPLSNDIVELSEVYRVKEVGAGIDKCIQYSNPLLIGRYDENHPFEMKDYKQVHRDLDSRLFGMFTLAATFFAAVLLLAPLDRAKKDAVVKQPEKVVTVAKDSLKTLKDTLKISKDSLKVPKLK